MEHALHLTAKHFVEDVNPTSTGGLLKKVKNVMAAAGDDAGIDLDALEKDIRESGGELDKDNDGAFNVADTIGKALSLVTQVSSFSDCQTVH